MCWSNTTKGGTYNAPTPAPTGAQRSSIQLGEPGNLNPQSLGTKALQIKLKKRKAKSTSLGIPKA